MKDIIIKDAKQNDIHISRILFGGSGRPFMRGECSDEFLSYCINNGLFTFDTARLYGGGRGEMLIGEFLKRNQIPRDKVTIITKCCHPAFGIFGRMNERNATNDIKESLKALDLSYVDCLLLHRDDTRKSPEETIVFMNHLIEQGYTRSIGVSNWKTERIEKANKYALEHGLVPFVISEPQFCLGKRICDPWHNGSLTLSGEQNKMEREYYIDKKMPVLCFSSLGNGMFAGKYKADDPELKKSLSPDAKAAYYDEYNLEILRHAEKLAAEKNVSVAQIALAYCFNQKFDCGCVASVSSEKRVRENLAAVDIVLSEDEVKFLSQI